MEELDAVSEAHLSVHNGVLFAAAQNFIGYSTDMGSSWRSGDVPFGFYPDAVRSLESTYYSCGRHVVRSVDGGSTWQTDREGLPSEEAYVSWSDPFGVYIGFQGPNAHQNWIYWKSNDSEPWEPLGIAPAEGGQVRSILSHGKQIFATGEDIRLSRLDDHMGPWYAWDEGLPDSRDARLLTVHDGWIYASPSRGGFYRRKLDGSTAVPRVPQHHQLPELSLHPQPADDILQLDVRDFASRGRSITVFDISGRCVAQRTVDGNAIISLTTESWDSGLYLVVLQGTWGMQTARCLIRH
ncbi:T9SS type A sorting domain-containing protein [bacterium]|nr:T9SS type A sorting domain-containing protein [bacterium]